MSREEERPEELKGFEAALAALVPRVEGFDRERLIFLAGRAAAIAELERAQSPSPPAPLPKGEGKKPGRWVWPAAFSAMTAAAATLLVMLLVEPGPQVAEWTAEPPSPAVAPAPPEIASPKAPTIAVAAASLASDRQLRGRVLLHGVDLWAEPVLAGTGHVQVAKVPISYPELRRELMESRGTGGRFVQPALPQWLQRLGDRS